MKASAGFGCAVNGLLCPVLTVRRRETVTYTNRALGALYLIFETKG